MIKIKIKKLFFVKRLNILYIIIISIFFSNCNNSKVYESYFKNQQIYCSTIKKINDVVLYNNFPPVIASRNYVYACIAGYESLVEGNSNLISLYGQIKHLPKMPKPTNKDKINFHLASLLSLLKVGNSVTFPEGILMEEYNNILLKADSMGMPKEMIEESKKYSDSIVNTIILWSKKDNYLTTRGDKKYFIDVNNVQKWIPTPPSYTDALEPNWQFIRTMILDSASIFKAKNPPIVNFKDKKSEYYKYLIEVKNIGDSLTDEEKHIADFWDDNPFKMNVIGHVMFATKRFSPPGHWLNLINYASAYSKVDFDKTAAIYAHSSIALFDAFISCWYQKYTSNYVRPETIINKYLNNSWRPYIQTPPFPSYTSGHGTISASVAEVLTHYLGDKTTFTDSSLYEFGIKNRQITSFRNAAKEAAMSRLYGGIHYRFDNDEGNKIGKKIGELIVNKINLIKNN